MEAAAPQDRVLADLLNLIKETGYEICQKNGQRHYGPPPNWTGPAPKGSEVFVGRIPRNCFEDELVPIFNAVGTIYEVRLMMDFSGYNRGFGFVRYTTSAAAARAVEVLNHFHIRPGCPIGVSKSVDNTRLFIGGLPLDATREEVLNEFSNLVPGVVDVIMYPCLKNRKSNRGFVFLEFDCHDSAALARRALIPGPLTSFGDKLMVDWAEPEPLIDEKVMKRVKVLYVRNLMLGTPENAILKLFSNFVKVEAMHRVKVINDYAFIHFYSREDAELVLRKAQGAYLDGSRIEIMWARPVGKVRRTRSDNRRVFHTGKYTESNNRLQQNMDNPSNEVECRPENNYPGYCDAVQISTPSALEVLENICKRFNWSPPAYKYREFYINGGCFYSGCVYLPFVRLPFQQTGYSLGPFVAENWGFTQLDVKEAAAKIAVNCILEYLNGVRPQL